MPSIELLTNKQTANSDSDSNLYYIFTAAQFELFPKVNKLLRTTFCNLALWNLADQYPNLKQPDDLENQWALGQVFIRENGLNVYWQADSDGRYSATFSFKKAENPSTNFAGIIWATVTISGLTFHVVFLTRK